MRKCAAFIVLSLVATTVFAAKSAAEYVADLKSTDQAVVLEAVKWAGEKKEKAAVPELVNLVGSGATAEIRMNAAVSLGLIGEKSACEPMSERLLLESNADVRYAIVLSITRAGIETKKTYENLLAARDKETDPIIKDYIVKIEQKLSKK